MSDFELMGRVERARALFGLGVAVLGFAAIGLVLAVAWLREWAQRKRRDRVNARE